MLAIQTLVKMRPSATAWTRTSTAHVLKATRERRANCSRRTVKPRRVKVTVQHHFIIAVKPLCQRKIMNLNFFFLLFFFISPQSHWQLHCCYSDQRLSWSAAHLLQRLRSTRTLHQPASGQLQLRVWSRFQRHVLPWKYVCFLFF